jgi:hypothetical protein
MNTAHTEHVCQACHYRLYDNVPAAHTTSCPKRHACDACRYRIYNAVPEAHKPGCPKAIEAAALEATIADEEARRLDAFDLEP